MRIIVTGANGFLGQHLMARLKKLGYEPYGVWSKAYDLRRQAHIDALFKKIGSPGLIFHLAANIGGIDHNLASPGSIYYDNAIMNTQFIHAAMLNMAKKFVFAGSVCSYPKYPPIPTREHALWDGYPEESHGPYGVSKLAALVQLEAYRQQFGFNFAYPLLANMYGPGDHFEDGKSHVIPALIKRFFEAKEAGQKTVEVWGDGTPTRDFLYVEDAAEALARFIEVDFDIPVNIATGQEVSIRRIAEMIADAVGYTGRIVFNEQGPKGQQRRCYNNSRARQVLGWQPKIGIEEGISRTVQWYRGQVLL